MINNTVLEQPLEFAQIRFEDLGKFKISLNSLLDNNYRIVAFQRRRQRRTIRRNISFR